jgi:hypothetical protein
MRFGRALRGEKGQEDCVRNAHTSKSMETCWKGRKSRAWQPWTQLERRGLAKQAAVSPAELTEEVLVRVWQTLTLEEARKKVRTESLANSLTKKKKTLRVWQTFKRRRFRENGGEARILAWVSKQDPNEEGKIGEECSESKFLFFSRDD